MKNFIASILLTSAAFTANAQLEKGAWMPGASIGSTGITHSEGYGTVGSVSLAPRVGRFVTDRAVVGASLTAGYATARNVNISPSRFHTVSLGVQPFMRGYFAASNEQISWDDSRRF